MDRSFRFFRVVILLALLCATGHWKGDAAAADESQSAASQPADAQHLPEVMQASLSEAIGQDDAAFAIQADGDVYWAGSPSQGLRAQFTADAALLEMGGLRWDAHLRAWGRGSSLSAPGESRREADANRMEYRYDGLTEWYVNGPMGVQQGFTLAQPPTRGESGPLTFALGLGGLTAQLDADGKSVTLAEENGVGSLYYAGLRAFDATGKTLPAWMEVVTTRAGEPQLYLRTDDHGAQYPVTVDPLAHEVRLIASDGPGDAFGFSVALNDQGNLAVVGAYGADVKMNLNQGVAYIFQESSHDWNMVAKLSASDGEADDQFGISVAISGDGSTVLVGANQANVSGKNDQGSAYVFVQTDGLWAQQARLSAASGDTDDHMGWSVSMSSDGNTALVSAHNASVSGHAGAGSAYVFVRSGTTWTQQSRLFLTGGIFATEKPYLGYSVALSADGNLALLGAHAADAPGKADQGLAFTFTRSGTAWDYQATLSPSDGQAEDYFGRSVALSADGSMALIGASGATVSGRDNQGAAYIFTRSNQSWMEQARLTANDGAANDFFGVSVSLMDNGYGAYIGAYRADVNGNADQGAVYTFARQSSASLSDWDQAAKNTELEGAAGDQYGVAVAQSGTTLLIGATLADVKGNSDQGAAFTIVPYQGSSLVVELSGTGSQADSFGQDVALSDDGNTVVIGANQVAVEGKQLEGAAYVFVRNQYGYFEQQARLVPGDGQSGDYFGSKVAISADGNTVLVGAYLADTGNPGAAYAFTRSDGVWSQQHKFVSTQPSANDSFGSAIALSDNGKMALIGSTGADPAGKENAGMALAYYRFGDNWSLIDTVMGNAAGDWFGSAVALSADGMTALVGACGEDVGDRVNEGAAYVYDLSDQQAILQYRFALISQNGKPEAEFGNSVALSDDGSIAFIGAYNNTVLGSEGQGIAFLYSRIDGVWEHRVAFFGEATGDWFGYDVALSGSGHMLLVSAPMVDVAPYTNVGKLYIYHFNGRIITSMQTITAAGGETGDRLGVSVTLSGSGRDAIAGADGDDVGQNKGQGSAYWYTFQDKLYLPSVMRQ